MGVSESDPSDTQQQQQQHSAAPDLDMATSIDNKNNSDSITGEEDAGGDDQVYNYCTTYGFCYLFMLASVIRSDSEK
jgi:hypothetical protein